MVGLVAVVAIAAVSTAGEQINALFQQTSDRIGSGLHRGETSDATDNDAGDEGDPDDACHAPLGDDGLPNTADDIAVGTLCDNGSVFAGASPSSGAALFAARCDAGQAFDPAADGGAGACEGTTGSLDGTSYSIAPGSRLFLTNDLAPDFCAAFSTGDSATWRLPTEAEMIHLAQNGSAIGNFSGQWQSIPAEDRPAGAFGANNFGGVYRASDPIGGPSSPTVSYSDAQSATRRADYGYYVRCVSG